MEVPAAAADGEQQPRASAAAEEEELMEKAQGLIAKIVSTAANPNPKLLHALASMLEAQESKYIKESGGSTFSNGRASHPVGRLGNLIREHDEFYELISSQFLSDNWYPVSVRAAAARILVSCSSTWMYPHVFEDAVLDNVKSWVMDDTVEVPADDYGWRRGLGESKPTDNEMLKTYATGLLAMSLAGGVQVVEDILTSGLSAKLMRYLRTRVFGEISISQKDTGFPAETKHNSVTSSSKGREENRGRPRQLLDSSRSDSLRITEECALGDQNAERDRDRGIDIRHVREEECWEDVGESLRSEVTDSSEIAGVYGFAKEDAETTGDGWLARDLVDGKARHGVGRNAREEDLDEHSRDDSSRRKVNRGPRMRGKARANEAPVESERNLTSPSSTLRLGGPARVPKEKNQPKQDDSKRVLDVNKSLSRNYANSVSMENDDRLRECNIGSKDISDLVIKAIQAAEAEARAANAPAEAVKAAGDAAAEVVKTAAFEVWNNTNDDEAAISAASKVASTVVDAAVATEVSRSSPKVDGELGKMKVVEPESDEVLDDFFIVDNNSLAHLRERYSIQCLEILGEYVEALGPVLKEKGVDVCLALLQRSFKDESAVNNLVLVPEVLKLIYTLAAHKKFAALFVDRGGMQKLLAVPRVSQTYFGLSSCLFTIGSLQGIMERVCALPSELVYQVVQLGLQLLECSQDQARKNSAVFFAAAFVFRAILDAYDAQDGLQKMLNLLHGAASVRSGGNPSALGASSAGLRNDRSPAEVLTASEKQIAYHTCVALRQYFRAHLLLLVDSLRPNKSNRGAARSSSNARAAYKPLDISNEAMDAVFHQIQRDRKLGPVFVRARWPAVDKFLACNGHIIMLELCQAPPVERYLHDLAQYALGVLHIVTFVPYSRKLIVNATLSNDRVGMAVILDAASGVGYIDPEVIQPALNVLVNLVCPPPSISNKPSIPVQGQQSVASQPPNSMVSDNRERHSDRHQLDRLAQSATDRNGETNIMERGGGAVSGTPITGNSSQVGTPAMPSGVVGDRRISLGPGAGCSGLAAQLEQGYRQAREAVRANNGIKVLLHLLHPRVITSPTALDCLRALACRVLLGLARDEAISHILTKLQVGKKLSELIRDTGGQSSNTEQGRWQTELTQVAIELIAIVTNSGRASTLAATDAAAPTLRRIERAAIAAATPITYHARELLLLIHEHLQASGLNATADLLRKEAGLAPLPSVAAPQPLLHHALIQENTSVQLQWPSGRAPGGFLSDPKRAVSQNEDVALKCDFAVPSSKKKPLMFTQARTQVLTHSSSFNKTSNSLKGSSAVMPRGETASLPTVKSNADNEIFAKTPILLPMKRKFMDSKDGCSFSPSKRVAMADSFQTPVCARKSTPQVDTGAQSPATILTPRDPHSRTKLNSNVDNLDEVSLQTTPGAPTTPASQLGLLADPQSERMTLDSLVVQYLKHQHRQCPAPITTLPPLSLLHPHVCPEPSHSLDAPANVTARISTREFRKYHGGIHSHRRDRQFVYSRFKPFRTCRDDSAILTCITFLGKPSLIATGGHSGEIKIFDSNNGNVLESHSSHQSPVTLVQSAPSGAVQLLLSSSPLDVKLWDASSISSGPLHAFDGCKAARFSNSGTVFAAFSSEAQRREVLLYDIHSYSMELKLTDSNSTPGSVRGYTQSLIHFSPSDTMLLWNGVLWDRRSSGPIHRFDQFTDYGGGGFHPAGNEVILNSEVWDLRKFKLLRSVPSLDQTVITFNSGGDVIYAILRRNLEDITSAVHTRRVRHPLFPAFRTIDAVNYSEIATVPVDRCVLDFAADPTDSYIGVVAMDDHEDMYSSARLYEIGRRRPTDDDSDPDDGADSDEDDEDDENNESEADVDQLLGTDLEGDMDSDSEDMSNLDDEDDMDSGDEVEDGDFNIDDIDFDGGDGVLEIVSEGEEGDEDDSEILESFSSGEEGEFDGNGFVF